MAIRTLKLHSQQSNGVTYADPLDPDFTVRIKTTSSVKMLDGQRTTNYVTEVIVNDNHDVTIGDKIVPDALSVRIRTSGSVEGQARLKQMLSDVFGVVDPAWLGEDVLLGFQPTTPPVNTVAE